MIYKCKICGGSLSLNEGDTICTCEYCGTKQTLPKLDSEKKASLFDRADHFRRINEYDKASLIYEEILSEEKTDSEVYWLIVLCRYGIEYVEDPKTKERIPTVNRMQYDSILKDEDYLKALELADTLQKDLYIAEAKRIDEIQKGILEVSNKEEPFDIFICYKETDENGRRTEDSVLAQDIYKELTNEGYKVFFSRITLEDKIGTAYEPYIFAALNSSKIMLAIGTKKENFEAVWVKNEWSRYLALIKKGQKKTLVPCYKNMDPYDLPEEFAYLQAQDMGKLGYLQDLTRGIEKIIGNKKETKKEVIKRKIEADKEDVDVFNNISINSSASMWSNTRKDSTENDNLIKRAYIALEDSEFSQANEYTERVLNKNPEYAEAYIVKLLVDYKLRNISDLTTIPDYQNNTNYQRFLRFADDKESRELNEAIDYEQAKKIIDSFNKTKQFRTVGINDYNNVLSKIDRYKKILKYKSLLMK